MVRESKPSRDYIMNFYRPKYVSCKKTESGERTGCPRGRGRAQGGRARPPPSCPSRTASYFSIFLNIPKQRNIAIRIVLESFTYRTTYLFLFGVWNVPKSVSYVFLLGYGFNNISFNIYWVTWDIMFDSLTVHHPRTSAFEVVDFYGTEMRGLLDNVRTFPLREKSSCKKS